MISQLTGSHIVIIAFEKIYEFISNNVLFKNIISKNVIKNFLKNLKKLK
jgi:hypothetical protein